MPFVRTKPEPVLEPDNEEPKGQARRVLEFMRMAEEMDRETLVLSLAALNTSLRDALPNDRALHRDLSEVRLQLLQRRLDVGSSNQELESVVHKHIHVHLWDEGTRERVAALGNAVVGFARKAMEMAEEFVEADRRATMKLKEAGQEFYSAFSGMVSMLSGRDQKRAEKKAQTSPGDNASAADAVIEKLGGKPSVPEPVPAAAERKDEGNSLAEDMLKAMEQVCATDAERVAVVRVMSVAIGQPIGAWLDDVRDLKDDVAIDNTPTVTPAAGVAPANADATPSPASGAEAAPPKKKFRFSAPQPEPDEPEEAAMGYGPEPG